jgi:hypothetical protein
MWLYLNPTPITEIKVRKSGLLQSGSQKEAKMDGCKCGGSCGCGDKK